MHGAHGLHGMALVTSSPHGCVAVSPNAVTWPSVDEETGLRLARAGSLLLTLLVASRFAT